MKYKITILGLIIGLIFGALWPILREKDYQVIEYTQNELKSHHEPPVAPELTVIKLHSNKPDVETQIYEIADKMGKLEWGEYLVKLAFCESSLNQYATNTLGNTPVGSIDRGLYQFLFYPNQLF